MGLRLERKPLHEKCQYSKDNQHSDEAKQQPLRAVHAGGSYRDSALSKTIF
jgi:hypothetical protein